MHEGHRRSITEFVALMGQMSISEVSSAGACGGSGGEGLLLCHGADRLQQPGGMPLLEHPGSLDL